MGELGLTVFPLPFESKVYRSYTTDDPTHQKTGRIWGDERRLEGSELCKEQVCIERQGRRKPLDPLSLHRVLDRVSQNKDLFYYHYMKRYN